MRGFPAVCGVIRVENSILAGTLRWIIIPGTGVDDNAISYNVNCDAEKQNAGDLW